VPAHSTSNRAAWQTRPAPPAATCYKRRGGAGVLGRGRARPQGGRAARRELGDVKYVYTRDGERIFKVVSFYLLRAGRGRIGDIDESMRVEVAEARWLPLEEAPRLLAYRGEREMAALAWEKMRA
jgi:hypothetical protein